MMDAYTHLDMSADDALGDLKLRMRDAGVERALIVETWGKDNRGCLDELLAAPSPQFRVAPCFRPEEGTARVDDLHHAMVGALRVRTGDMPALGQLAAELEASGRWLLPHGELGIKALVDELLPLAARHPELHVMVPHMGWPRRDGRDDPQWREAIWALGKLPHCLVGVSAIAHFSCADYPHNDLKPFVAHLLEVFGAGSLVAASDYPLFEKSRYREYMNLAFEWTGNCDAGDAKLQRSLFGDEERAETRRS
jgi:predicted TIM-barrel fold metal-dependent hydrolase